MDCVSSSEVITIDLAHFLFRNEKQTKNNTNTLEKWFIPVSQS